MEICVQGLTVIIDDEDYKWVSEIKEKLSIRQYHRNRYVFISKLALHKLIFAISGGITKKGYVIDHINRNSLDNRRINLRLISNYDNIRLNKIKRRGTSKYVGVSRIKETEKWKAQYSSGATNIYIGVFDSEIEAAKAHDGFAVLNIRNPLRLNFPDEVAVLREILDRND